MWRGNTAGRLRPLAASAATWRFLWGLGIVVGALRGLRFAHPYARSHWLFHYGHGFVKRGLPGQLVRPLMLGKGPTELRIVTDWLTALLAFTTACALVSFSLRALERVRPFSPGWWVVVLSTSVLVLSPFVASLANLSGYFDQLLVLATLGAVVLVADERPLWAGLVGVLAVLSHEMFALFGLPVVAFACWNHERPRELGTWLALVPPVLALAVVAASERFGGHASRALIAEVEATRAIPEMWSSWGAHALTHDVEHNLTEVGPRFLAWFIEPAAVWSLHPTTLVMTLLALSQAVALRTDRWRRGATVVFAIVVIVAPWGIALLGWDWPRFFVMAQLHAHVVALVLVTGAASLPEPAVMPWQPRVLAVLGLLALAVTAQSLSVDLPRVASNDEDERPFALHTRSHFTCTELLFPNSNFAAETLSPWRRPGAGLAFRGQPLMGDLPARRGGQPVRPFHEWIGTAERHTDHATGLLASPEFDVRRDQIAFRIGGSAAPDVYVRLVVDGREHHRAQANGGERLRTVRWNVARLRGRQAVIELVDRSPHAHLNVEGFCYSR